MRQMKKAVTLICDKKGCPRKLKIDFDEFMPKGTVTVKSTCPWHIELGMKSYPSIYYDKNGIELEELP